MPTELPPESAGSSPVQASPSRRRATGAARFRQRPPAWTALLTGVFAIAVFAATDTVLRLLSDQASPAGAPASGATPAAGASAAPGSTPGAASGKSAGPAPAAGDTPATKAPAANDSAAEDTNVEEAAEGPRRAAPARPSDDEAPEFRESADNNISLPVDI